MILKFLRNNLRALFYIAWFLLNLIQSATTGLLDDEAYYWAYSRFLDWGYFDHPPMIAAMIRIGFAVFPNEFGVRLLVVLMSTATLWMIDRLLVNRDDKLFYSLAASLFLLQVGSIIAVPDLPLMFFIALFFTIYRNFLTEASLKNGLFLGLAMACMLYSKYHGILIIFFTLLSNLKLIRQWQAWLAAVVGTALFFPHLVWQYNHGFPSVSFHLFERNAISYQFEFTLQYVLSQLLLTGPLIGWLVLYAAFRKKPGDLFEKSLKWTTVGIFALFLVATIKGRAEANWTVPAFVGLIVLAHQYLSREPSKARWIYRLLVPSLLVVFVVRIYMMADVKPLPWVKKDEFHKTRNWAQAIKEHAGTKKVAFLNSYQRASQYWFYTGDTSFSLNSIQYRRNNYNFWPLEKRLQGEQVLLLNPHFEGFFPDTLHNERKTIHYRVIDSFHSYSNLRIDVKGKAVMDNRKFRAYLRLVSSLPPGYPILPETKLFLALYARDEHVAYAVPSNIMLRQLLHSPNGLEVTVNLDTIAAGKYRYKWAIGTFIPDWPTLNSTSREIEVK